MISGFRVFFLRVWLISLMPIGRVFQLCHVNSQWSAACKRLSFLWFWQRDLENYTGNIPTTYRSEKKFDRRKLLYYVCIRVCMCGRKGVQTEKLEGQCIRWEPLAVEIPSHKQRNRAVRKLKGILACLLIGNTRLQYLETLQLVMFKKMEDGYVNFICN